VQELLFGYEDELIGSLATIVPSLRTKATFSLVPNITSAAAARAIPRNVMDTGLRSAPELKWTYKSWQGRTHVRCWNGHAEALAGGSDALQFPSGLTPADPVHVFVPELFRMAKLNATGEARLGAAPLAMASPPAACVPLSVATGSSTAARNDAPSSHGVAAGVSPRCGYRCSPAVCGCSSISPTTRSPFRIPGTSRRSAAS
jgi:CD36 family